MLRILNKRPDERSDADLLAAYRQGGDTTPLGELYARYMELVYGLCLKYLKDEGKAEDAVMGIFEELVRKTKEHEVNNFRSWLYVLAKNYCLMQLRKEKKNLTVSFEPEFVQSVDQRHHTIELDNENGELEQLEDCLQQLNVQQKRCVQLFYLEGKSYKEIAESEEQPLGTVRSHIQNGRRNLRICMEKMKNGEWKIEN
jgi:RNA polymerase sigma-70 factor (ECF subfamily)